MIKIEIRPDSTLSVLEPFELAGVTVPMGFVSDGVSIPRAFWYWRHPYSMPLLAAAIVHDYCQFAYGDAVARDKFKLALSEVGAIGLEQRIIYNAVRARDWFKRNGVKRCH